VARGLDALPPDLDLVIVHDAARPLVTPAVVERVVAAARRHGAAAAVLPVRDTLHRVGSTEGIGPVLSPGVGREGLARAQTPQAARAHLLRAAFAAARAGGGGATDEVGLLLALGVAVVPVAGTLTNIKITEREDLDLALRILPEDA
jgi:2-C-methyl-D-erythritol 4-phosphate cytidylyltransferase